MTPFESQADTPGLPGVAMLWGTPSANDSVEVLVARSEQLSNTAERLLATLEMTTRQVVSLAPPTIGITLLHR